MNRRHLLGSLAASALACSASAQSCREDHIAWVSAALIRMQQIHPGMTREKLLTIFTTEGGISTDTQRTFVSRDCLYFKVDVTFKPIGRPPRGSDGRASMVEDDRDEILTISRPYLQFGVSD